MFNRDQKTLSEITNELTRAGFTESFKALENSVNSVYSKKSFNPEELKIVGTYRFEGATNPSDEATLFAIEAKDGTKGTLTMSYGYQSNQNDDMIKRLKEISRDAYLAS